MSRAAGAGSPRRVLGVDPGTAVVGWGVVEPMGVAFRCVASGTIRLTSRAALAERLRRIHMEVGALLEAHGPAALALEKAFVARNVQSALRLGEARGAVLIAAAEAGIPVYEYAPAEVKLKVVGYGRADKPQMVRGVALRLGTERAERADEADAQALALCQQNGGRRRALVRAQTAGRRS